MFVKTQFNTIVNLAEFEKIKIEWDVLLPSESVHHVISAESQEIVVDGNPVQISKFERLAEFPRDMVDQAQKAYDDLFAALLNGDTAFDIRLFKDSLKGKD